MQPWAGSVSGGDDNSNRIGGGTRSPPIALNRYNEPGVLPIEVVSVFLSYVHVSVGEDHAVVTLKDAQLETKRRIKLNYIYITCNIAAGTSQ